MADANRTATAVISNEGDIRKEEVESSGEEKLGDWEVDPTAQLPPEVQRRVWALKKIQMDVTRLEAAFYTEMHLLEQRYAPQYQVFFDKRRQVTDGEHEPTDDECVYLGQDGEVVQRLAEMNLNDAGAVKERVNGIPHFWLTIFEKVELLKEMTTESDVPILKHLTDIVVELINEPMGFKLHFHFSPNEYFKNPILTKTYEMKCELDQEAPFSFEGPEIIKCSGCPIDWFPGKNVTVKIVAKKQKHNQRGSVLTVTKTVDTPSFFNFFNPPLLQEDDADEETRLQLADDFEIGQFIRERIVPHAVLFYTGEALNDDDDEEDSLFDENEDDDDEEEVEQEDADEDEGGSSPRGHSKGKPGLVATTRRTAPASSNVLSQ